MLLVALHRGSEVILGALVGWIFHWLAEVVVDALADPGSDLRGGPASHHGRRQPVDQQRIERIEGD
jgi:hypothetical protein